MNFSPDQLFVAYLSGSTWDLPSALEVFTSKEEAEKFAVDQGKVYLDKVKVNVESLSDFLSDVAYEAKGLGAAEATHYGDY